MAAAPKVTVVIPTHNRRAYLQEALGSALGQEQVSAAVIVVDDGSTDDTGTFLEQLQDSRVRALRVDPGRGGSAARNLGLAHCVSEYVMFLDDDDVLRPKALASLSAALDRQPTAAGAGGAYARFGAVPGPRRNLQPRFPVTRPLWPELLLGWNMPPATLLWRSEAVRQIGGWNEDLRRCEDRDINLRAYPGAFTLIAKVVMDYRVHADQIPSHDHTELNRQMLRNFVDSLPPTDRARGEGILRLREDLESAVDHYRRNDFELAIPVFRQLLDPSLGLRTSPVVGAWLVGLYVKASIAASLPRGIPDAARRVMGRPVTSR